MWVFIGFQAGAFALALECVCSHEPSLNPQRLDEACLCGALTGWKKQDVEWQNWFRGESWDNIYEYWAQQNQELD